MGLPKINRTRLMVIVPAMTGMVTAAILWFTQEPAYGVDGIIRLNNPLDPHVYIIYTLLSIILSAVFVDVAYWLADWCKKQCFVDTGA